MRSGVLVLIVALSFPFAYADCPEGLQGKYPGWAERFYGNLSLSASTSVANFDVTVARIFGTDAIQVNVLRDKSQYIRDSIETGRDGILKKSDILIELHNITDSNAHIGIYTPKRANITTNVTNIDLLTTEGVQISLLPGEELRIDFSINNTGELEARGIHIIPQFADFEILRTDARDISYLCPGSSYDFKYTLKTPDLRKVFNYTMYLKLEYFDENIETGEISQRATYYLFEVEIIPALVEISRHSGSWTLKNPGRDIPVRVTINNTGDEKAYNVEWSADIPPYVAVGGGTTSFKGSILEGKRKVFNYAIVSDDPVMCQGVSRVTYEDRAENAYTSFSNNETFRFSPFITIDKKIGGLSWHVDPTKNVMLGTTTWAIDEAKWWDSRTSDEVIDSPAKVSINKTANLNVSVKIKNMGNAVARGVTVRETLDGLKSTGIASWEGELKPDEEAFYNYTVNVTRHGNLTLITNIAYLDVDLASFKPPLEDIEGKPKIRYCTVTLESVTFGTKDEFYGLYPNVSINQSELKVLGGSEFDFNVTVLNNGSDSVHDVLVRIDTSDLKSRIKYGGEILKGQSFYYLKELRAKHYPEGSVRDWDQTSVTYNLVLRAPDVDIDRDFKITTTVNYTDFTGNIHSKNATANLTVFIAVPAYEVVTIEKKNLSVTSGFPGEMDTGGYGDAYIKLKNTGYADLENVTIKIEIPEGLEIYSNDTAWQGRFEVQLRRLNETWYGFTGDISWNGSLNASEERTLPLLIRGKKAGLYEINCRADYNEHRLATSFAIKVRGAILRIDKSLSDSRINVTGNTEITVSVKNIGEASARGVIITDYVPSNFEVSDDTMASVTELKPGEETVLKYTLRAPMEGNYTLRRAAVSWTDELGNEYQKTSSAVRLEVTKAPEVIEPAVEEGLGLSPKQIIATALFSLVFLWIIFKFLLLSRPVSKE